MKKKLTEKILFISAAWSHLILKHLKQYGLWWRMFLAENLR